MLKDLIEYGHAVRAVDVPMGSLNLHCMVRSAGYEQRMNEVYSWDGLKRGNDPFVVIQHTLAGRGHLDYSGTRYLVEPGQTMALTFPHANRYWLEQGESWDYFWLVLNGREALRVTHGVIERAGPVFNMGGQAIDRLASACLGIIGGGIDQSGAASAAAYAAVMALHDGMLEGRHAPIEELPAAVERVKAYIDANLGSVLDVERLARIAGTSRWHFVRQFSGAVGEAPSHYLFRARMERASRLLLATDMSIGAIAAACGFSNGNYLAKSFRRTYGMAPLAFRNANRDRALGN
ncbi:AraC family transcriptional regulator [Devosia rhodophyticola]|uniref:AraC family transcriptional regulator n=1 Tax=Devosia rhodophyticola TaxID=3026423 RepID=A0ABY7YVU3_9HYPH|nr:AraC family transcriptional regulator [Devosia rhodophyticola]WDR04980.1 AraC family transcriptional regulator [Devosia rhodophyticola]